MSDIESAAKSIVHPLMVSPHPGAISSHEQRLFAVWATLRTMVFDSLAPEERQYYSHSDRMAFRSGRPLSPPANTNIWIAQFIGIAQARFRVVSQVDVTKDYGRYFAMFVINKVAVVFVTWKGHSRTINVPALTRDQWPHLTRHMWPSRTRALKWPPIRHLTDETLQTFGDGFTPRSETDR